MAPPGIVLLGPPRSGTTLLRRLLGAHSRIACPGETNLLRACARFLASERGAEGVDVGVLAGLDYAGFPEEEVLGRLREFAFGFFREHAARQGKPRWAEKSAFDAFHVPEIEALCAGEVTYVCVLRHGLDVALSIEEFCRKTQGYLEELHRYVQRDPVPLAAFARAWHDTSTALLDLAGRRPEQAVVLRYEDLVARPAEELGRVLEFLGEALEPGMVERALEVPPEPGFGDWKTHATREVTAASVGRWKGLPPGLRRELAPLVNATLERLGYERIEEGPPPDRAEARRRYALGLRLHALKRGRGEQQ